MPNERELLLLEMESLEGGDYIFFMGSPSQAEFLRNQ